MTCLLDELAPFTLQDNNIEPPRGRYHFHSLRELIILEWKDLQAETVMAVSLAWVRPHSSVKLKPQPLCKKKKKKKKRTKTNYQSFFRIKLLIETII